MLTTRYHIASLMAIFLALGIGIFIGGTLGDKWMDQAENSLVHLLMNKYESQLAVNKELEKQVHSLQMVFRQWNPMLEQKKVMWIRPDHERNDMLAYAVKAAGADWVEASAEAADREWWAEAESSLPDIILISGSGVRERLLDEWAPLIGMERDGSRQPMIVDVSSYDLLEEPEQIADFLVFLKQLTEGGSEHASSDLADPAGLQRSPAD